MYQLVILATYDPRAKMKPTEVPGNFEYRSQSKAEDRGIRYLAYCPDDIVMLVSDE